MFTSKRSRLGGIFAAMVLVFSMAAIGTAEARMGGSFGSRGMRTYHAAPTTTTAPRTTAPVQNSMTRPNATAPTTGTQVNQPRPSFWSGFGGGMLGGMLGGLFFSGLFGSMFGMGFGGLGGGFFSILQLLLVGGLILWLVRRFRGQRAATAGGYGSPFAGPGYGQGGGYGSGAGSQPAPSRNAGPDEIGITGNDLGDFERMLNEVQSAFSSENHQALRRLATPEMVSYLSEELAENATKGVKNDVTDLRFIRGDLAEAWSESGREYATVAMNWSAIDVLRDRQTGAVVKGDEHTPLEATELWTFVRDRGGDWQLSAIQEAAR